MASRARFSLGARTVFCCPSSHTSIAGSTIRDLASVVKSPMPCWRKVSFCRNISCGLRTFCSLVAK